MPGRNSCLVLAAVLFVLICGTGCRAAHVPVARVNDVVISQDDLIRFINLMELCNPGAVPLQESNGSKRKEEEILHILIGFELVNQAVADAGIVVAPEDVEVKTEEMMQTLVEAGYASSPAEFQRRCRELSLDRDDLALFLRYRLQVAALFDHLGSTVSEADLLRFIEENPQMFMQPAAAEIHRYRFIDEGEADDCLLQLEQGTASVEISAAGIADWSNLGWVTRDDPFLAKEVREQIFSLLRAGRGCLTGSPGEYDLYWIQRVRPAGRPEFADEKQKALQLKKCQLYEKLYHALWNEGRLELYSR